MSRALLGRDWVCSTVTLTGSGSPRASSLDHLVGAGEQRVRHRQVESACGLEVENELVVGWLLYRRGRGQLHRQPLNEEAPERALDLVVNSLAINANGVRSGRHQNVKHPSMPLVDVLEHRQVSRRSAVHGVNVEALDRRRLRDRRRNQDLGPEETHGHGERGCEQGQLISCHDPLLS
jgi:hypothetical protein